MPCSFRALVRRYSTRSSWVMSLYDCLGDPSVAALKEGRNILAVDSDGIHMSSSEFRVNSLRSMESAIKGAPDALGGQGRVAPDMAAIQTIQASELMDGSDDAAKVLAEILSSSIIAPMAGMWKTDDPAVYEAVVKQAKVELAVKTAATEYSNNPMAAMAWLFGIFNTARTRLLGGAGGSQGGAGGALPFSQA